MKKRIIFSLATLGLVGQTMAVWTMTARAGYESAEFTVVESDGSIEIREYPGPDDRSDGFKR